MRIGLINVDSKIPNLALMKISTYHKAKGHDVHFYSEFADYDLIYASKVFSYTPDYRYYPDNNVIKGGSGYIGNNTVLPDDIEHTCPDYSLYPCMDYSLGFITRGCIRTCNFCIVPKKEGYIRPNADIDEFTKHKNLVCLDNNILSSDFGLKQIEKIISRKIKVDFNQGLDARIINNPDIAELLSRVKWLKPLRMAMDNMGEADAVIKATELLRKYKTTPKRYFIYLLVRENIADAYERVNICKKYGLDPFAQPYLEPKINYKSITKEQIRFCKWVNIKMFFKNVDFYEFTDTRKRKKGLLNLCSLN